MTGVSNNPDGIRHLLESIYGPEDSHAVLRESHAALRDVLGLHFYAVDEQGEVVVARRPGPEFCRMIQSTPDGLRACQQHVCASPAICDDGTVGACHAGLATWTHRLQGTGWLAGCGGREAGRSMRETVMALADKLGLDPEELYARVLEIPEHTAETFREVAAALTAACGKIGPWIEALDRARAASRYNDTRIAHVSRELEAITAEYEQATRETFSMNEELLAAHRTLQSQVEQNQKMFMGFVRALSSAIDAKDPYTHNHSQRVTQLALMIGQELSLDEDTMRTLEVAGFLHDIGKIGMPENILNKPGRLTKEEYAIVKTHPSTGARILAGVEQLDEAARALKHHHERLDGGGYPDGVAADEIPLASRILAVADTYDAIVSDRPYRDGGRSEEAISELRRCAGTQFDPQVVEALMRIEARDPLPGQRTMAAAHAASSSETQGKEARHAR